MPKYSKLSFQAQAPPGYKFIPAGDPQLTSRCKKLAKDEQLTVFIVSVSCVITTDFDHVSRLR